VVKYTLKTILPIAIVYGFSACSIKIEDFYHSNATVESHATVKVNDKTLAQINKSGSKGEQKKEKLEKYLNKKINMHELFVEEHIYDSIPFDEIQFLKKMNFTIVSDKVAEDSIREISFNINIEPYKLEEVSQEVLHMLEQAKKISDTLQDTRLKNPQKIEQALIQIRKMMGERENSWDGKKLNLNVRSYERPESDKPLDTKELTAQEIEQMAQFISKMLGEVTISYARVFDRKIKKYKTDHPLYQKIDHHTLGFNVNIIDFVTKNKDEYRLFVETK